MSGKKVRYLGLIVVVILVLALFTGCPFFEKLGNGGNGDGNGEGELPFSGTFVFTGGPPYGDFNVIYNYGGTLYAGAIGGGVYESSDQGESWSLIDTFLPYDVNALTVCNDYLFAGTDSGVYRISLTGSTWEEFGLSGYRIDDLLTDGGTVYAAIYDKYNGVMSTQFDSNTWQPVGSISEPTCIEEFDGYFYAGNWDGVHRFDGVNWSNVLSLPIYDLVEIIGTDLNDGLYAAVYDNTNGPVMYTTDNGTTWSLHGNSGVLDDKRGQKLTYDDSGIYVIIGGRSYYASEGGDYEYVGDGSSDWLGDGSLYSICSYDGYVYGTGKRDQGIFKSEWVGQSLGGTFWYAKGSGTASGRVTSLLFDNNRIFSGTDTGVFFKESDIPGWSIFGNNPPDGVSDLAETDGYLIACCNSKLPLTSDPLDTVSTGVWYIPLNGGDWNRLGSALDTSSNLGAITTYEGDIFVGAGNRIYRMRIGDQDWEDWGTVSYNVVSMVAHDGILYAAVANGPVYWKPLSGGEWQELGTLDLVSALSDAYTIVSDGEYIYVSFRWGISASDITYRVKRYPISGGDWEDYGTGLPTDEPIYALYIYEDWIFAGTESTLYVASLEDGVFEPYNTGLPARARILTIKPGINKLYIGTNGKGVWATE